MQIVHSYDYYKPTQYCEENALGLYTLEKTTAQYERKIIKL